MVINPKSLGLEHLKLNDQQMRSALEDQYEELRKMYVDLKYIAKSYRIAYELYQNSGLSPVGYKTAMEAMNFSSPREIVQMYQDVEQQYFTALTAFENLAMRICIHSYNHIVDEDQRKIHKKIYDEIMVSRNELLGMDPHTSFPILDKNMYESMTKPAMEGYLTCVRYFIQNHINEQFRSRKLYNSIVKKISTKEDDYFKSLKMDVRLPSIQKVQQSLDQLPRLISKLLTMSDQIKTNVVRPSTESISLEELHPLETLRQDEQLNTYADAGYNVSNAINTMYQFLKMSDRRKDLKKVVDLLSTPEKKTAALLHVAYAAAECCCAFDMLNFIFYRIGKDLKSSIN